MRKYLVLLCVVSTLSACRSGHVNVGASEPADTPSTDDTPPPGTKASSAPSAVKSQNSIFFSAYSYVDQGKLLTKNLGFISDQAQTRVPYLINYESSTPLAKGRLFVPWANGVMFVQKLNSLKDGISFSEIPGLKTKDIYTHSTHIVSLVRSEDRNWLGWVDDKGAAFLWHSTTKTITPVPLTNFKAKSLQILSAAGRVLITGENTKNPGPAVPEVLLFNLGESLQGTSELQAISGQLSRTGKWLALIQNQGAKNVLIISNQQNPDENFQLAESPKNTSFQVTWSGDESLAYMANLSTTEGDLIIASIADKTSKTITHISSSYPVDQIACPSWRGADLYFGSFVSGKMSISASKREGSKWTNYLVAVPDNKSLGFGCPNAERN